MPPRPLPVAYGRPRRRKASVTCSAISVTQALLVMLFVAYLGVLARWKPSAGSGDRRTATWESRSSAHVAESVGQKEEQFEVVVPQKEEQFEVVVPVAPAPDAIVDNRERDAPAELAEIDAVDTERQRVERILYAPEVPQEVAAKVVKVRFRKNSVNEAILKAKAAKAAARGRVKELKEALRVRHEQFQANKRRGGEATPMNASPVSSDKVIYITDTDKPEARHIACDVPCRISGLGGFTATVITFTVDGMPWRILMSMEGPAYYSSLRIPTSDKRDTNLLYATTDLHSDIPVPYYSEAEYRIANAPVPFDSIPGASFMARNCNSRNGREIVVKAIMRHIRVDSMSSCMNNARVPDGANKSNKTSIMERYLFHLAFENQCEDDYITEKLWGSLESGTLPVYFGAPNVLDHVPPNSIVDANSFGGDWAALGQHLAYLSTNKTAYMEYHAWRNEPLPDWFVSKYAFTRVHSMCRMCRWLFAKQHGVAWDHGSQDAVGGFASVVVAGEAGGFGADGGA